MASTCSLLSVNVSYCGRYYSNAMLSQVLIATSVHFYVNV